MVISRCAGILCNLCGSGSGSHSVLKKSLVLLSQHPFVGLFSRIVAILGPVFFDTGQPMLEAACMNIANWYDSFVLLMPFDEGTDLVTVIHSVHAGPLPPLVKSLTSPF